MAAAEASVPRRLRPWRRTAEGRQSRDSSVSVLEPPSAAATPVALGAAPHLALAPSVRTDDIHPLQGSRRRRRRAAPTAGGAAAACATTAGPERVGQPPATDTAHRFWRRSSSPLDPSRSGQGGGLVPAPPPVRGI